MTEPCRDWRADLAAHALGRLDADRTGELLAHCHTCAACDAERKDLATTAALLPLADLDHVEVEMVPPVELRDRVVASVRRERDTRRRRRRTIGTAAAAVIAVLAFGAGVLVVAADRDGNPPQVAFDQKLGGAWGRFTLTNDPQGTQITLVHGGLDPAHKYWLWVTDASGNRTGAGTFWGSAETRSLTMHAALGKSLVARVWITDDRDQVVLDKLL